MLQTANPPEDIVSLSPSLDIVRRHPTPLKPMASRRNNSRTSDSIDNDTCANWHPTEQHVIGIIDNN
jgi:hypothetical protein